MPNLADFVHRSVPNFSTSVRSEFLDYFFFAEKLTASYDGCWLTAFKKYNTYDSRLMFIRLLVVDFYGHPRDKKLL